MNDTEEMERVLKLLSHDQREYLRRAIGNAGTQGLNELRDLCHSISKEKGWHSPSPTFAEAIALAHSELSEALEEFRDGVDPSLEYAPNRKPEGCPAEFADCLIRILDTCGQFDIDIEGAVRRKLAFNRTRPHRHGNKVL